ncbi:NAD-dependent epimerase/dehydratase family protein [Flagellimonas nanhaiensis]|uniref:NAD-dependent epimerase/dehydratase family protein n=2 Tax=Flagellimonas nanhaiensis TaxID=2292706 RepID=A0A371JRV8_9FLAO|nr:NAD-dependent epimerase/dehydratase family protein [Allomuricauda nanhaiensis]
MILVTGGTGLIGSHLLFHLTSNGKEVRATFRSEDSIEKVEKIFGYYTDSPGTLFEKVSWVQADITDVESMSTLFDEVDQVYHVAALISFDPKDYKSLVRVNTEGTSNVVNLCLKHRVKKLCHVSSIAAIGPSLQNEMATEENEWSDIKVSGYGLTKHDAELEVWRGSQEGLSVVIVNPGVVIGPGFWKSGSGSFFTYAAKGKKSFIPGGTGFVSVNDVVRSMTMLMDSKVESERFILVNENMSYGEFFQRIAPHLDVSPPSKEIPFWALELFWRWDWLRSNLLEKRRRLTKTMAKGLYKQENYSSEKIIDTLNFQFDDLDEVIRFCSAKFKNRNQ